MSATECRRRADELDEIAASLPPGVQRDEYAMLARHWRELAVAVQAQAS